ncbi:MAG: hypothetical protein A4S14_00595 [Proteobacteria bacterium SG_bin9]|nr:MAG: hypothetical protein A4S14_00595 [Proteobacteria bacterium SG_bin9]
MRKTVSIAFLFVSAAIAEQAQAAPASVLGKSVVVNWTEDRQQKVVGEETMRNVSRSAEFSVYISDKGRPFSRMRYSFSNMRGGLRTGNRDKVGGEGGGNRNVSFSGNTMNVTMRMGDGGARNIVVNLAGDSCSAQVIAGKAQGASHIRTKSMITGNQLEVLSIKTSGASCSVRSGNVFGN